MSLVPRRLLHSLCRNAGVMWLQNAIPGDCPSFQVDAANVHVINEPIEFFEELVRKSRQSEHRITLSSLYIGTGPKERQLIGTVRHALECKPRLRATLLFDYTRSTRVDQTNVSSKDVLRDLVSDRSRVSLFLSPEFSKFFKKFFLLPSQKKNEIVSLQHMKCFVFDNDVIISGANLSEQYFEDRSDRYILFTDCKVLADYFDDLVKTVAGFSLSLASDGSLSLDSSMRYHPLSSRSRSDFIREARSRIRAFKSRHASNCNVTSCQTSVTPLLQMNEFGINDDTGFTCKLLASIPDGSVLKLASGYFNLTRQYQDLLHRLSEEVSCDVLMASEKVNSFYGAKGLLGYIPSFYTTVSRQFFHQISESNSHVRLWSFYRPNWTFHTKGLWIKTLDGLLVSTIGSSNFGYRSAYKDLELQVVLATKDPDLQKRLTSEHESIWRYGSRVNSVSDFPRVPLWVQLTSRWIKGFF